MTQDEQDKILDMIDEYMGMGERPPEGSRFWDGLYALNQGLHVVCIWLGWSLNWSIYWFIKEDIVWRYGDIRDWFFGDIRDKS